MLKKKGTYKNFAEMVFDSEPLPEGHYFQVDAKTYGRLLEDLRGTAIIQLQLIPMEKVKKLIEKI
jgi:hypothetical protein